MAGRASVIAEIDIWRSARLLIRQHGEKAAAEATRRAETLQAAGDRDGWAVWRRIAKAIECLQGRHAACRAALN